MSSNETLLEQWCNWLFDQKAGDNAAGDIMGGVHVKDHNQGKDPWYIPGTWGQVNVPARRRITVPHGNLFIVAASSHATFKELVLAGEEENVRNLKAHVELIDKEWFSKSLHKSPLNDLEGNLEDVPLDEATTEAFDVNINDGSPYRTLTGITGGRTKMMTVGHVKLLRLEQGKTRIVIAAQSPEKKIKNRTEKQYNVHIDYEVTVP